MKKLFLLYFLVACASKAAPEKARAAPEPPKEAEVDEAVEDRLKEEMAGLALVQEQYPAWVLTTILQSKGYYKAKDVSEYIPKDWKAGAGKPKKYYIFKMPECCDILTPVYGADGKEICKLGAGFAGREDPKCAELFANLKLMPIAPK